MTRSSPLARTLLALIAALLIPATGVQASATTPDEGPPEAPKAVVNYVVTEALNRIVDERETLANDRAAGVELFNSRVRPWMDTQLMARFAMGPAARTAEPAEIERLATALADRVANLYAGALQRYAQEAVDFAEKGEVNLRLVTEEDDRAIVNAIAQGPDIDPLELRIQLYKRDERWRVFDIEARGVSMLLVFRDALQAEAGRDGGVDAMIAALEEGTVDVEGTWEEETGDADQ